MYDQGCGEMCGGNLVTMFPPVAPMFPPPWKCVLWSGATYSMYVNQINVRQTNTMFLHICSITCAIYVHLCEHVSH